MEALKAEEVLFNFIQRLFMNCFPVKFFTFLFLIFFFFPSFKASASVIINEISWMGNASSSSNEWIELYNQSSQNIVLEGWVLKAADEAPKITLKGVISGNGFYLLERRDENTLPNIPADIIYHGALENKGENLILYDNAGRLIDQVNYSDGWPAGNNDTKQTMERTIPGEWKNSRFPGGTPKKENNQEQSLQPPFRQNKQILDSKEKKEKNKGGDSPTKVKKYPNGIVFSEILPSPEGPDKKNEWIEIQNQNNFEIGLSGWRIKDKKGKTNTYVFPESFKISPRGYLVLKRPKTKIVLNNSGDELELISPDEKVSDSVIFGKAPLNQSYNRTSPWKQNWKWSLSLTPGRKNIISSSTIKKTGAEKNKSISRVKIGENNYLPSGQIPKNETADIGGKAPKSPKFFTFLIASVIALSSSIAILFLKKALF